jgi:hypothetical protein
MKVKNMKVNNEGEGSKVKGMKVSCEGEKVKACEGEAAKGKVKGKVKVNVAKVIQKVSTASHHSSRRALIQAESKYQKAPRTYIKIKLLFLPLISEDALAVAIGRYIKKKD